MKVVVHDLSMKIEGARESGLQKWSMHNVSFSYSHVGFFWFQSHRTEFLVSTAIFLLLTQGFVCCTR